MPELAIKGGPGTVTEPWPKWPIWNESETRKLREVLEGDLWGGTGFGPKVSALNERFAQYCDAKYGAAVCNGTVSMELALRAMGIGPGDEVIVPAATFIATSIVVSQVGATPVFVDIEPDTLCLDPERAEDAVSDRTRAMIPVHLGGHPCDMEGLLRVARKGDLKILEDAAQAHGAIWSGRKLGAIGDAGSYSFQQSKNLQCGEGGMVVTNDRDLADLIHYSLGKFGRGVRDQYAGHIHYRLGRNACITEFQAAIALAQLERLEEQTRRRAENGKLLIELLGEIEGIEPLRWKPYCDRHGYHLFLFRFDREAFGGVSRGAFLSALDAEGVPCATFYPMPLFRQPMYDTERMTVCGTELPIRITDCPETEQACREIVFLEQHLLLAEQERMEGIGEAMRKIRRNADALRDVGEDEAAFMGSAVLRQGTLRARG